MYELEKESMIYCASNMDVPTAGVSHLHYFSVTVTSRFSISLQSKFNHDFSV